MSIKDWTTRELVVAAVLAVAVGVIFWAWGLLWSSVFQLVPFPFHYAFIGIWMIGGLLVPYVVRRPGAALSKSRPLRPHPRTGRMPRCIHIR